MLGFPCLLLISGSQTGFRGTMALYWRKSQEQASFIVKVPHIILIIYNSIIILLPTYCTLGVVLPIIKITFWFFL